MSRIKAFLICMFAICLVVLTYNSGIGKDLFDKENTSLTIYNQNFALVKDYRKINFKRGLNTIEIDDVASLIDPTSVHLKSLSSPNSIVIQEQNYRYDLIEKSNILDKMVGEKIKFRNDGAIKEGILLNPAKTTIRNPTTSYYGQNYNTVNSGNFAIKTSEGILLTTLNDIILKELPEGLYPMPTLVWKVDSAKAGNEEVELAYLTDGVNWYADYIAVVDKSDKNIDLTAWVTLDNKSGISYNNASLKLVAGDVRKIKDQGVAVGAMYADGMARSSSEIRRQFQEESFFEYHLYTLNRETDVKNNETKQLTLTSADKVPTTKKYIYDPLRNNYYNWIDQGYYYYTDNRPGSGRDTTKNKKVNVVLEVQNSKKNHLGIPLPKGKVRVYKRDSSGAMQFIGEDEIDHTPEDEKLNLYIGDAFDIVASRKAVNYKDLPGYIEASFEFEIKNHKKEAVEVEVYERVFGDWEITEKSFPYDKKDAHTIVFPVKVAAKSDKKFGYTIKVKKP